MNNPELSPSEAVDDEHTDAPIAEWDSESLDFVEWDADAERTSDAIREFYGEDE